VQRFQPAREQTEGEDLPQKIGKQHLVRDIDKPPPKDAPAISRDDEIKMVLPAHPGRPALVDRAPPEAVVLEARGSAVTHLGELVLRGFNQIDVCIIRRGLHFRTNFRTGQRYLRPQRQTEQRIGQRHVQADSNRGTGTTLRWTWTSWPPKSSKRSVGY
jgi:hypothetical protein